MVVVGALILVTSLVYTRYLSKMLAQSERTKVENFVTALHQLSDPNVPLDQDVTFQQSIISSNTTIPVAIVNDNGGIDYAANFERESLDYVKKEVEKLKKDGFKPIPSFAGTLVYYKESRVLRQLRYFPLIQLILIAAFIGFGYISFSSARRAEQNRVWVGMAKETAHQLGTPISAIIAWIEHLKLSIEDNEEAQEVLIELRKDVERLELVADRFSKIGAAPVLQPINIYEELDQCRAYMQARAPRKVTFHFPEPSHQPLYANLNPHLFDWVVENLLRNAIDAMDGKGSISAAIYEADGSVSIDISDTGKGIPSGKFRTVFQPGYTTKKRGWGLGLSLAKRIIEDYHNGKIFVKRSEEGKGTTFTIRLPKQTAPVMVQQELIPTKAIG